MIFANLFTDTAARICVPLNFVLLLAIMVLVARLYVLSVPKGWPDYFFYAIQGFAALGWALCKGFYDSGEELAQTVFILSLLGTKYINIKTLQHYFPKQLIIRIDEVSGLEHKIDMRPVYTKAQHFQWITIVVAGLIGGVFLVMLYMQRDAALMENQTTALNVNTAATNSYLETRRKAEAERAAILSEVAIVNDRLAELEKNGKAKDDSLTTILLKRINVLTSRQVVIEKQLKKANEELKKANAPKYNVIEPKKNFFNISVSADPGLDTLYNYYD